MSKVCIVYGSTTGNTELVAKQIGEVLAQEGITPNRLKISSFEPLPWSYCAG